VLTLLLDDAAQERFDALRREHFPPERNHLRAHVTLFHALPGELEGVVRDELERSARRPAYDVEVVRVRSLGRGVAFDLRSPLLAAQRAELAARWADWLTPQDAAPTTRTSRCRTRSSRRRRAACWRSWQAGFVPHPVRAEGLGLWRYLGGPWEPLGSYRFSPTASG
jgi:hypothetical protein